MSIAPWLGGQRPDDLECLPAPTPRPNGCLPDVEDLTEILKGGMCQPPERNNPTEGGMCRRPADTQSPGGWTCKPSPETGIGSTIPPFAQGACYLRVLEALVPPVMQSLQEVLPTVKLSEDKALVRKYEASISAIEALPGAFEKLQNLVSKGHDYIQRTTTAATVEQFEYEVGRLEKLLKSLSDNGAGNIGLQLLTGSTLEQSRKMLEFYKGRLVALQGNT